MKKILLIACLGMFVLAIEGKDINIPLVKNGKALYSIYYADNETFAAKELAYILEKMTNVRFPVLPAAQQKNGNAFIIGQTPQARKAGADFSKFAPDEWFVKLMGKDIILSGGYNKGSLYAVYELMERYAGVSFPAWDVEVIPRSDFLRVPEKLFINSRPAFLVRTLYDGINYGNTDYTKIHAEKRNLFNVRNRETANKAFHQFDTTTQYYYTHNLYFLVPPKKYFKTHPEYYSMNEQGKRFLGKDNCHGSQLCFTNPDVAKVTVESLFEFIGKDRKKYPNGNHPTVYNLTQLDDTLFLCKCPPCKELTRKEGSEAAILLLYINAVQEAVNKKYPDVKIETTFYVSSEKLPKTMRPHKNVIVRWVDLYTRSDCYRPLTSRFNQERKKQFLEWAGVVSRGNLFVRDYYNMKWNAVLPPRLETVVDAIPEDLRFFHKHNTGRYFAEVQDGAYIYGVSQVFLDLEYYLARRMMIDPYQDSEKIIAHYMKHCFGPAADTMTAILNNIREGVKNEPVAMFFQNNVRSYQTNAFLRRILTLWNQAVKETSPNTDFRSHVEREGLMIMATALKKTGLIKGEERKSMIECFRKLAQERIRKNLSAKRQKLAFAELEKQIKDYDNSQIILPVPELFKNVPADKIHVFGYPHFRQMHLLKKTPQPFVVDDPLSPVGKAVTPPPASLPDYEKYAPNSFGVFDYGTRIAMERTCKAIPQDEKYHWFYVGVANVQPSSFFWAFRWYLQCDLLGVWKLSDGIKDGNKWHVYVSSRHTGPVYVKGSKSPNKLFIDYVVLTKDKVKLPK